MGVGLGDMCGVYVAFPQKIRGIDVMVRWVRRENAKIEVSPGSEALRDGSNRISVRFCVYNRSVRVRFMRRFWDGGVRWFQDG